MNSAVFRTVFPILLLLSSMSSEYAQSTDQSELLYDDTEVAVVKITIDPSILEGCTSKKI